MRDAAVLLSVLMFVSSCDHDKQAAKVELDGELTRFIYLDHPAWKGCVKNRGEKTAWNCMVEIRCYGENGVQIDVAEGFPDTDRRDSSLLAGERADFKAIAWHLSSHEQIEHYNVIIRWSDKEPGFPLDLGDLPGLGIRTYSVDACISTLSSSLIWWPG